MKLFYLPWLSLLAFLGVWSGVLLRRQTRTVGLAAMGNPVIAPLLLLALLLYAAVFVSCADLAFEWPGTSAVSVVKALDRWLARKEYRAVPAVSSDAEGLRRAKGARRDRRLVPDALDERGKIVKEGEERRLLAAASPWLQRLIIAAVETGCRRGELLNLTWGDVDLTRGEFVVRADTNKTGQGRRLPISPRFRAVLDLVKLDPVGRQRPGHHRVFGNAIGEAVACIKEGWETTVLEAHGCKPAWTPTGGLSPEPRAALRHIDLNFHDLRHEAGSRLLEAGWPLHHVQQMLGRPCLADRNLSKQRARGAPRIDEALRHDTGVAIRGKTGRDRAADI